MGGIRMKTKAEQERFLSMIDENKKIIYKVSHAYCRNAEDRKDLVQEILVQIWKSADKYDEHFKLSTWIYRIAMNVAISHYRRQRRTMETLPMDENILEVAEDAEDSAEINEKIPLLYRFIDSLDDLNKALIILYLEENSYKTISEILGITETNVATKMNRIKKKLKEDFSKEKNI
jgi:RNA polymerase sigma-70 factor (ECF subfamily)